MLPPLRRVKAALGQTTEALAAELALAGRSARPDWNAFEWRLAQAAAVAHGVSPLLARFSRWNHPDWRRFLEDQRLHVEQRHARIRKLLERIDAAAHAAGLAIVPLKGSALHAIGLYAPGDRPMADIDLLVRAEDSEPAIALLNALGYVESFAHWRHLVFKPATGETRPGLGEHRDTPINIELHTRIRERLPVAIVDITGRIYPDEPRAGLNPYPSNGALMSHLLLHAAGNICSRNLRLLHLHDIALLAMRMAPDEWKSLLDAHPAGSAWWALPPLRMVARYYRTAIPQAVIGELAPGCSPLLRAISAHQTLTRVSCSELWLHALPGIEWSHSLREAALCIASRIRPSEEKIRERHDLVRTNFWLQGQSWSVSSRPRRILTRLTRRVPRIDTMYVVRAALEPDAAFAAER